MRHAALHTASRLAASHPAASLPCPLCGASVRAANLDAHAAKVHGATPGATADEPLVLTGKDERVGWLLLIPVVPTIALSVLASTALATNDVLRAGLVLPILLAIVPVALAFFGKLRAHLTLHGDEVRLRYALGLLETRARLPLAIEVGPRVERRTVPGTLDEGGAEDVRTGVYLRLGDALTIGAPKGTGFRAHWSPASWRAGRARRRCDVTLDRIAMIALEYHLVARGQLAPR